ncbi:hypothetical protein [Corynebacterium glyciniphilum]|uniref:hypothetical protein n=1 Tax=Corynebacterium glyciniphilum TaxID=1404244 RepID=UPI003FD51EB0
MARTDFAVDEKWTADYVNELGGEVNGKADKSEIPSVPTPPTADTLSGATAVGRQVMKAADAAAARSAIGAGTSNVSIGSGATDAKAGNYVPAWSEVTGKPTIPAATAAGTRAQLDAGTDTTVRAFSAKDIAEYVAAQIDAATTPEG